MRRCAVLLVAACLAACCACSQDSNSKLSWRDVQRAAQEDAAAQQHVTGHAAAMAASISQAQPAAPLVQLQKPTRHQQQLPGARGGSQQLQQRQHQLQEEPLGQADLANMQQCLLTPGQEVPGPCMDHHHANDRQQLQQQPVAQQTKAAPSKTAKRWQLPTAAVVSSACRFIAPASKGVTASWKQLRTTAAAVAAQPGLKATSAALASGAKQLQTRTADVGTTAATAVAKTWRKVRDGGAAAKARQLTRQWQSQFVKAAGSVGRQQQLLQHQPSAAPSDTAAVSRRSDVQPLLQQQQQQQQSRQQQPLPAPEQQQEEPTQEDAQQVQHLPVAAAAVPAAAAAPHEDGQYPGSPGPQPPSVAGSSSRWWNLGWSHVVVLLLGFLAGRWTAPGTLQQLLLKHQEQQDQHQHLLLQQPSQEPLQRPGKQQKEKQGQQEHHQQRQRQRQAQEQGTASSHLEPGQPTASAAVPGVPLLPPTQASIRQQVAVERSSGSSGGAGDDSTSCDSSSSSSSRCGASALAPAGAAPLEDGPHASNVGDQCSASSTQQQQRQQQQGSVGKAQAAKWDGEEQRPLSPKQRRRRRQQQQQQQQQQQGQQQREEQQQGGPDSLQPLPPVDLRVPPLKGVPQFAPLPPSSRMIQLHVQLQAHPEALQMVLAPLYMTGHCIAMALTQMAAATSSTSSAIQHAADAMHRLAEALQGLLSVQAAAQLLQRVAAQRALLARAAGAGLVVMLVGVWGMALLRGQVWLVHQACSSAPSGSSSSSWGVWRLAPAGARESVHWFTYLTCCGRQLGLYSAGLVLLAYITKHYIMQALASSSSSVAAISEHTWWLDVVVFQALLGGVAGCYILDALGALWQAWLMLWWAWCGLQVVLLQRPPRSNGTAGCAVVTLVLLLPAAAAWLPFQLVHWAASAAA